MYGVLVRVIGNWEDEAVDVDGEAGSDDDDEFFDHKRQDAEQRKSLEVFM